MRPSGNQTNRVRPLFVLCVVLQTMLNAGCVGALLVGAAGGAAGTVYVMGQLKDEIHAPVPKVRKAAVAGLKGMGLPILVDKGDKLTATIESQFSDDKHVWITIESKNDSVSHISIRVGMLGDEQRSRRILEALRRHL